MHVSDGGSHLPPLTTLLSQLPGFSSTGRFSLTSSFSFGDESLKSSNKFSKPTLLSSFLAGFDIAAGAVSMIVR